MRDKSTAFGKYAQPYFCATSRLIATAVSHHSSCCSNILLAHVLSRLPWCIAMRRGPLVNLGSPVTPQTIRFSTESHKLPIESSPQPIANGACVRFGTDGVTNPLTPISRCNISQYVSVPPIGLNTVERIPSWPRLNCDRSSQSRHIWRPSVSSRGNFGSFRK